MIVQKKYKISSKFTELNVTFTAGILSHIDVNTITDKDDFLKICRHLTEEPTEIEDCIIKELKVNSQKQKIALWCSLYKIQYGNDYKVTQREAGMLKGIELTQNLINLFFDSKEWWAKEKTIARITSNYNELKRISNNKQQSSARSNPQTKTNFNSLADEFRRRYS